MNRSIPRTVLLAPALAALLALGACNEPAPVLDASAAASDPASSAAFVVAGGPSDASMDSLRAGERLAAPDDDVAAARLRDAHLPDSVPPAAASRPR